MAAFSIIGNNLSTMRKFNHETHFSWQVQYLVRWRLTPVARRIHFICEKDQLWESFLGVMLVSQRIVNDFYIRGG